MLDPPRAVRGRPRAMARPRRPTLEAVLVMQARDDLDPKRSMTIAAIAKMIAVRVANRVVSFAETPLEHADFDVAKNALEHLLECEAIEELAFEVGIDTHADFMQIRIALLEARGGQFLDDTQYKLERQILRQRLARKLAGRYARHLRT